MQKFYIGDKVKYTSPNDGHIDFGVVLEVNPEYFEVANEKYRAGYRVRWIGGEKYWIADGKAQQVAVPLTPEQAHEALTAAGIGNFYMTHSVTRKELWFTQGSTDVMSIVRALEAKHGIGAKP